MIRRIVKMTFREEEIETFQGIFEEVKPFIRSFEGCEHLELWQDVKEPRVFFTYSHWQSEDYLNHYRQSSFFEKTWKKTKSLFAEKPQAWSVRLSAEQAE